MDKNFESEQIFTKENIEEILCWIEWASKNHPDSASRSSARLLAIDLKEKQNQLKN